MASVQDAKLVNADTRGRAKISHLKKLGATPATSDNANIHIHRQDGEKKKSRWSLFWRAQESRERRHAHGNH